MEVINLIKKFKQYIKDYADLCGIEIKSMRKSKKFEGIFVYGYDREYVFLDLQDYINKNFRTLQYDLHKAFNKPLPKVIKIK